MRDIPKLDNIEDRLDEFTKRLDRYGERLETIEESDITHTHSPISIPDPAPIPTPKLKSNIFMNVFHFFKTPGAVRYENGLWVFDPVMLSVLRQYGGIRFLDWQEITDRPVSDWNQQVGPGDNYLKKGVPLEACIELCNQTACAGWFIIPPRYNVNWLKGFQALINAKMHRGNEVYVELSNEVWHRNDWEKKQAGDWPEYWKFHIKRMLRAFGLLKNFEGHLVITVFSGQHDSYGLIDSNGLDKMSQSEIESIDMIATAPYSGLSRSTIKELHEQTLRFDEADMIDNYLRRIEDSLEQVIKYQAIANEYGLEYGAYEYNQHLATTYPATVQNSNLVKFLRDLSQRQPILDGQINFMERWNQLTNNGILCRYALAGDVDNWGNFPDYYRDFSPRPIAQLIERTFLNA